MTSQIKAAAQDLRLDRAAAWLLGVLMLGVMAWTGNTLGSLRDEVVQLRTDVAVMQSKQRTLRKQGQQLQDLRDRVTTLEARE